MKVRAENVLITVPHLFLSQRPIFLSFLLNILLCIIVRERIN